MSFVESGVGESLEAQSLLGACATGDTGLEGERALQPTSAAWWEWAGPISADQHIPELA